MEEMTDGVFRLLLQCDPCVVKIGANPLITGYVDRVAGSLSATTHTLSISGRGKCEDLADCAAQFDSFQFTNMATADIAPTVTGRHGSDSR
ncbi:phage baseplate assembly protein [Paraburkholderia youngii]|uniref:phage baseplate assembly protein n=1 Tax=Paraburkholderia youngii TaxID=2782701 RepID=UPI003D194E79